MGTHLRVLSKSFPMITNMTRFRWFSKSLRHCSLNESNSIDFWTIKTMLNEARIILSILTKSYRWKQSWGICWGEILLRTQSTTLLQILCKIILNSKVIVKNSLEPDDNFSRNSYAWMGQLRLRRGKSERNRGQLLSHLSRTSYKYSDRSVCTLLVRLSVWERKLEYPARWRSSFFTSFKTWTPRRPVAITQHRGD